MAFFVQLNIEYEIFSILKSFREVLFQLKSFFILHEAIQSVLKNV